MSVQSMCTGRTSARARRKSGGVDVNAQCCLPRGAIGFPLTVCGHNAIYWEAAVTGVRDGKAGLFCCAACEKKNSDRGLYKPTGTGWPA